MHKYQPRIRLVLRSTAAAHPDGQPTEGASNAVTEFSKTFVFPETVFIAVTAYQNQLVSEDYFRNETEKMRSHVYMYTICDHYYQPLTLYITHK